MEANNEPWTDGAGQRGATPAKKKEGLDPTGLTRWGGMTPRGNRVPKKDTLAHHVRR